MPSFDRSYIPPAAVTAVVVGHPFRNLESSLFRGKLDTGADLTVIPESLIADLDLAPRSEIWARSYDGSFSQRPVYYVRLVVEGFELSSVRCIATSRSNILLGRNVLNRFFITLDGKKLKI